MKKKKDSSSPLFLIIFACLAGWIFSIVWIERSNTRILKEIDRLSIRLSFLEERLKEKRVPKEKPLVEPQKEEPVISKIPSQREIPPLKPSIPEGSSCKIAIILDDAGYGLSDDALSLIEEGFPLTIAILPELSFSKETAEIVHKNKGEVFLHLPMEAMKNGKDKGVIGSFMEGEKIKKVINDAISNIPHCVGVNNHMGSKATADTEVMKPVLEVIKEKNLCFVDSLTTSKSIAYKLAKEMGVSSGSRDIFIDNNDKREDVLFYLYELIKIARKKGFAIGIGHIYKKATISILKEELPNLEKAGIELVPVSAIVK